MRLNHDAPIAVLGLGYVGLPLALAFGSRRPTVGYDVHSQRVAELRAGKDRTGEAQPQTFSAANQLRFTDQLSELAGCGIFVVAVPTPVDEAKHPDLAPLIQASQAVGSVLSPGDIVIYESTVYPGATEEVCIPELERASGLKFNVSFACGYSPERINPGDPNRGLADTVKVTSGSTPEAAAIIDDLYKTVVPAGTYRASSIRVAEAAKVIENTQRDLNIALVNELAKIFNRLDIDTEEVLLAAGSKWNFLPFRPGLVGGHCIGVDPYYLTHKAIEAGYHPEVILAGRRINDGMGEYLAGQVVRLMATREIGAVGARVLVMGLAFKEGCADVRNTRVVDVVAELGRFGAKVDVWDPWVDPEEAQREFGLELISSPEPGQYDAVILAVAHPEFLAKGATAIRALCRTPGVVFDVKSRLPRGEVDGRL